MGVLTIYRRHTRSCTKGYQQNQRIYRPNTKREQQLDCECPIVASGCLRHEARRVQHLSLETTNWDDAEAKKKKWEEWQGLISPTPITVDENPTIQAATEKFLEFHGPNFKEWERATMQKYSIMFRKRLFPFCQRTAIDHIKSFDSRSVVNAFVTSWRNTNPTRNRLLDASQTTPDVLLGSRTKQKELERFRYFLAFCHENGWLGENHAKSIKLKSEDPDPKFGLEREEVDRVFETIECIEDCHGRVNQHNAHEMRAFCLVSYYTGLRVNAVTNLDSSQIVPCDSGEGYAIKIMDQEKTGWVRIPIPIAVYRALAELPFKATQNGKKYWFYTQKGTLKTNITTWRKRMARLFHQAQDPDPETGELRKPFLHHASPAHLASHLCNLASERGNRN